MESFEIKIEDTPLYEKTRSFNASLKILRIFLFLDQCHDFLEENYRNKWYVKRGKVYEILKNNIITDLLYIDNNWNDNNDSVDDLIRDLSSSLTTMYTDIHRARLATQHSILKIAGLLQTQIGIRDIDLGQIMGDQFQPEEFAKHVLSTINPIVSNKYLLLAVDADRSYASFSHLANFIEDDIIDKEGIEGLKIFQCPATAYDPSSGSTFIKNLQEKARQKRLNIESIPQHKYNLYSLRLTAQKKDVMSITYNKIDQNNDYYKLTIHHFFNTTPPCYHIFSAGKDSTNSVSFLTTNYNPEDNVFLYKTFGDFGQILSFHAYSQIEPYRHYNCVFSSFDTLSAYISSLFNKSTLLETCSKTLRNNLNIFSLDNDIIDSCIEKLRVIGIGGLRAASILNSMKLPGSGFGKKSKVSIRNTSTRVLKAKLKSVGVPVTKVVRGKRMKLTRKQLEMRAEAFKRLQIRCQKKGINLTFVSKKGRKYKSAKRLLSNLKRQPKFKPKTKKNIKPKMKWG